MSEISTTYEPDNSLKKGYLSIFSEIFNEIKKNRWLTYQLFKRDFLWGTIPQLKGFLIASVVSVIILLICLIAFHLTETRIAERV